MNKTQSIIFVIAVLAIVISANLLYINRPKGAKVIKLALTAFSADDAIYDYVDGRLMELEYHHDTLKLQFYHGDPKLDLPDKEVYTFVKNN